MSTQRNRQHPGRRQHPEGSAGTASPAGPRTRRLAALVGVLAATALTAAACGGSDDGAAKTTTTAAAVTTAAVTTAVTTTGDSTMAPAPTTTSVPTPAVTSSVGTTTATTAATATVVEHDAAAGLTDEEIAGLVWMREEEKLARDVYTTLGELWGVQIFDNIAQSEQSHTDAVLRLLDAYGLADPATDAPVGVFADPTLQQLHDDLVAKGSLSLTDALAVGATIEDLDIVDLQERATEVADIAAVYAELEKGSRNHLRAFVSQLEAQGAGYSPQYLSPEAYSAIVTSETERGPAAR